MDFTNTQPLLHAYIKYCARTLILRALVYVLVTFSVLFRIKTYISSFGRYFFVKSTITTIFSKTILCAMRICSSFSRSMSSQGRIYGSFRSFRKLLRIFRQESLITTVSLRIFTKINIIQNILLKYRISGHFLNDFLKISRKFRCFSSHFPAGKLGTSGKHSRL